MTDKQITALAREYAEEAFKTGPHNNDIKSLRKFAIKLTTEGMEKHLRWLCERYCLVKKERVIAELKAVDLSIKAALTFTLKVGEVDMAKKELLHALFPDLGKEVNG